MNILILNCGSSSAKFAVIDSQGGVEKISGLAQRLGSAEATLEWKIGGQKEILALPGGDHEKALRQVVALLGKLGLSQTVAGVGHRVLHGGIRFSGSVRVNPEVIAGIEACNPLGPLHNPPNLLGIRIASELFPSLPQVAVFDTAFHRTMPPVAYRYAIPNEWYEKYEVRRYGFHGTSHRYVSAEALSILGLDPKNHTLITAHLGNGCSAAAVKNGQSVDTTMGLTPLEGLVMGTRSGSIDPALVGHVAKASGQSAESVIDQLNKKSGLLGLSGVSNDMRALLAARDQGNQAAKLAVDVFCSVLAKSIASLVVPLGRLDALVFTGGIGENSAPVRAQVVEHLGFLGLTLDPAANNQHGRETRGRITRETKPQALIVPTNEELMIARDTASLVA